MKFGIYTLGCKVNTYESEYVVNDMVKAGYILNDFNDINDIYIINTCTVTNNSDSKSRKMINKARRLNPKACILVMGCFVEYKKDIIKDILPEVDLIIGNNDKSKVRLLIDNYMLNKNKLIDVKKDFDSSFDDMFIKYYNNKTRAFVKIQDGCENYCSYCIIPKVRGKCRSKDLNLTIKEIELLVKNGFKEIVLTGIHTGNYGVDLGLKFSDLLKEIIKIKGLCRLRISSIEITELTDEVLDIIKDNDIIVNHLHIPVQSTSNKILKLMNRKYNIEYFIDKVEKIRKIKPDISITTDIISGHPGEDEEEFKIVLDNCKKINFSKMHVFTYSIRDNTKSKEMKQIPDNIKKKHTDILLNLSKEMEINYMNKFINKELDVLFETYKDGYSYGHTTNYLNIKVKGKFESSTFKNIVIKEIKYPYCIGL